MKVVTRTGTTFDHEIPVAVPTPEAHANQLVPQALVGAFVGILPVSLGLMFYPALRGVGPSGMSFLLALTIGLLASSSSTPSRTRSNWRVRRPPPSRDRSWSCWPQR